MRQVLPILSFLFFSFYGHSQAVTKNKVLRTFKRSISQDSKKKVSIDSNPWIACNTDSAFFNKDTVRLYNSFNRSHFSGDCCTFIDWTFYKKNAFVQTTTQLCKEPTTGTVPTKEDWFVVSFAKYQNDIVLETRNQDKIVNRFRVITIDKVFAPQGKEEIDRIVLVRMK